jgi:hypothetical protein
VLGSQERGLGSGGTKTRNTVREKRRMSTFVKQGDPVIYKHMKRHSIGS